MSRQWIRDNPPHWDEDRERILGKAPKGAFPSPSPAPGALLPGEWWRVLEEGVTVAFGWMETNWGDGEILLAVDPARQHRGLGTWILEKLEHEARLAGLNYIHNVVRPEHAEKDAVTSWLMARGFKDSGEGRLKRRVADQA